MTARIRRLVIPALAVAVTAVGVLMFGYSDHDELCTAYGKVERAWKLDVTDSAATPTPPKGGEPADPAPGDAPADAAPGKGDPEATAELARLAARYRDAEVRQAGRKVGELPEWHDGDDFAAVAYPIGRVCP